MKAINIKWDASDSEKKVLPDTIQLPDNYSEDNIDEISDYISDFTGYCHYGFDIDTENYLHDFQAFCSNLTYRDINFEDKIDNWVGAGELNEVFACCLKELFKKSTQQDELAQIVKDLLSEEEYREELNDAYDFLMKSYDKDYQKNIDYTWALYNCDNLLKTALIKMLFHVE